MNGRKLWRELERDLLPGRRGDVWCATCERRVGEFEAIAEKWGYKVRLERAPPDLPRVRPAEVRASQRERKRCLSLL
jgi:hypothetical protein